MNNIEVSVSVEGERARLNRLYQEACPHFKKVEGRPPLKPLDDITGLIGDPPEGEQVICYTIYADAMIAGYAWLLEKPTSYYYIFISAIILNEKASVKRLSWLLIGFIVQKESVDRSC